jgi:hypothetical protein
MEVEVIGGLPGGDDHATIITLDGQEARHQAAQGETRADFRQRMRALSAAAVVFGGLPE